jgi:hypothetical protein
MATTMGFRGPMLRVQGNRNTQNAAVSPFGPQFAWNGFRLSNGEIYDVTDTKHA